MCQKASYHNNNVASKKLRPASEETRFLLLLNFKEASAQPPKEGMVGRRSNPS